MINASSHPFRLRRGGETRAKQPRQSLLPNPVFAFGFGIPFKPVVLHAQISAGTTTLSGYWPGWARSLRLFRNSNEYEVGLCTVEFLDDGIEIVHGKVHFSVFEAPYVLPVYLEQVG